MCYGTFRFSLVCRFRGRDVFVHLTCSVPLVPTILLGSVPLVPTVMPTIPLGSFAVVRLKGPVSQSEVVWPLSAAYDTPVLHCPQKSEQQSITPIL